MFQSKPVPNQCILEGIQLLTQKSNVQYHSIEYTSPLSNINIQAFRTYKYTLNQMCVCVFYISNSTPFIYYIDTNVWDSKDDFAKWTPLEPRKRPNQPCRGAAGICEVPSIKRA